MQSLKTFLLGTTLTAGALFFMGTSAHADEAYTVQSGDTLSTISQKYVGNNSLVQSIAEKNAISNINLIYSGQQLMIPTEESVSAGHEAAKPAVSPSAADVQPTTQPVVAQTATPATTTNTNAAKEWIAQKESSGSYTAANGRYIGRYQLDAAYLNGDYSPANQERVAEQYVASRYGSWEAAQAFWLANGWY